MIGIEVPNARRETVYLSEILSSPEVQNASGKLVLALGKNIGGTLGQPHEGRVGPLELTFYDPIPDGALANDDLELQLVWLAKLREVGPGITERDLGQAWRDCLTYPWDEYGLGKANLFRGLEPPVSGQRNNWFTDSMGSPIRSEIWACVAPGCPDLAAALAYQDGCVDHGGEGLFGEIFFAALESAAFVLDDREALLDLGLSFLPPDCRTAKAVRVCRERHAAGDDWLQCRQAILDAAGHVNFTDAPQNIAFTILGWLYGEDAGDAMCKAVNCGCDTDCTGATLGAILGILHGPEYFDEKWVAPVGEEVKIGYGVINCEVPKTLGELTDWTAAEAVRMLEVHDAPVRIGMAGETETLCVSSPALRGLGLVAAKLANLDWKITKRQGGIQLVTDYGGEPTIAPGGSITLTCTATGEVPADAVFEVVAPNGGWGVRPGASHREPGLVRRCFRLEQPAGEEMWADYQVAVSLFSGLTQLAAEKVTLVAKTGWRISGPVAVEDAPRLLGLAEEAGGMPLRPVYTDGHALVLDAGLNFDRAYLIETVLHNPHAHAGRLVCAAQEMQIVYLNGEEVIRKVAPTPFVPAPHRSGEGTAYAMETLPELLYVRIAFSARAGERAEVHLYLTEPADESLRRCCPLVGVVATAG